MLGRSVGIIFNNSQNISHHGASVAKEKGKANKIIALLRKVLKMSKKHCYATCIKLLCVYSQEAGLPRVYTTGKKNRVQRKETETIERLESPSYKNKPKA